ncbi:TIGR02679 domain-containing protein [Enterococcus olivae]
MNSQLKNYFKQPVFRLLAKELSQRYYRNGDFGRSIGFQKFAAVDTNPLRSLLGITNLEWGKKRQLKLSEFATALKNSSVAWEIEEFVQIVNQQPLILRADEEYKRQKQYERFQKKLDMIDFVFTEQFTEPQLLFWLDKVFEDMTIFNQVAKALNRLPKEYTLLPVFAYQITGDPHAFDEGTDAGTLLSQMLRIFSKAVYSEEYFSQTEAKHQLLSEFYLLRDDVKNYAAIRGLTAIRQGKTSALWQGACEERSSWNVPLKEICRMDTIFPEIGNQVLIVENSGVYSILVDLLPDIAIICSSGQFTYAIWTLLRKLSKQTKMYYVGDMDPEGLVMAQRLKEAFPEVLQTIGMTTEIFQKYAQPVNISERRIKQLRLITEPSILIIARLIEEQQTCAYQEGFIDELLTEVRREFEIGS